MEERSLLLLLLFIQGFNGHTRCPRVSLPKENERKANVLPPARSLRGEPLPSISFRASLSGCRFNTGSALFSVAMTSEPLLPKYGKDRYSFDFPPREGDFLLPQLSVKLKDDIIVVNKGTWRRAWIVQWGRRRVVDPFAVILRRGLEPKLLSLSLALGLTFGLFPLCGATLLLCAIAAVILQSNCNVPTLILANLVVSPFELGLVVPFMHVGELVTRGEHFTVSPGGLWETIRGRVPRASMFGMLHAIIGWSMFAPVSVGFLYITSLPVFRYLIARFGPNQVP